jgi:hypothetical protein
MKVKILFNLELLNESIIEFDEFNDKIWNGLESQFGFSIRNAKYEFFSNEENKIDIIEILLNNKGYEEYKFWKYRIDRLDIILNNN